MILIFLLLSILSIGEQASISNPHIDDSKISKLLPEYFEKNSNSRQFFNSSLMTIKDQPRTVHHTTYPSCNIDIKLQWMTDVNSAILATPVVFPSGKKGSKQIFVSTYHQFIELVQSNGYKLPGWPITFEESSFPGSPLLYDIDGDGNTDIGVVDRNANLFW